MTKTRIDNKLMIFSSGSKKNCLKIYMHVLMYICLMVSTACAEKNFKVAIFSSDSHKTTLRAISGAKMMISQEYPDCIFTDFTISSNPDENLSVIDDVKNANPGVILTIGTSSTEFAKENFEDIPVIFAGVKYPLLSGFVKSLNHPNGNITGASIDIPFDIQFQKFKQIIPDLEKIGVLFTQNTESLIPYAKKIAEENNLTLVAIKINSETEIKAALDSLNKTVQGIWSVADQNLFNAKSTRFILMNTIRYSIPFMGFSRYVVESGALFALDFDYKAVGFQAGNMVNQVFAGKDPGDISVTSPDFLWFLYNERTSKRINIEIPSELAAVAKEVYR